MHTISYDRDCINTIQLTFHATLWKMLSTRVWVVAEVQKLTLPAEHSLPTTFDESHVASDVLPVFQIII